MRVIESCIVTCPASVIYDALSKYDFSWWALVETSGVVSEGSGIGVSVILTFKDKTVQKFRVVESSELKRSVTLELVESSATTVLSVIQQISVTPITKDNAGSFVQWQTDFSFDAGQDVLQDSRFKKLEAFGDMQRVFGKK